MIVNWIIEGAVFGVKGFIATIAFAVLWSAVLGLMALAIRLFDRSDKDKTISVEEWRKKGGSPW